MGIQISLLTWWRGKLVGQDGFGNKYYEDKHSPTPSKARRWVIFKGIAEASKVPAEWHGWLHHTSELPPLRELDKKQWQRDHQPNLTGTVLAYKPDGFVRTGKKGKIQDYEPWEPSAGPKKS